jgi:hypothetical protein
VYNIISYTYAHLLVLISYLISQFTVTDHLKDFAKCSTRTQTCTDPLELRKQRKMDRRFGNRNVKMWYRSGSMKTVIRESVKYKLELMRVQELRWDKGGTD